MLATNLELPVEDDGAGFDGDDKDAKLAFDSTFIVA